jgi:CubicO group peptidase (beta-lactamase class C family)
MKTLPARSVAACLVFELLQATTSLAAPLVLPAEFEAPAVDRYLASWTAEKQLVGLSVAIVKDGQVVQAKGYGHTSVPGGRREPITPQTRFAIGSVTKQFTCACILLLAEDGRLSVNDKVAQYYPGLTRAADITLLDLMNHTSGYRDYYPLDFVDHRMQRPIAPDDLLQQYAGAKLDFEPGANYSYSNTGYILLGRIVEKVSGESFGAFLARRILQPLGLTNTVFEPAPGTPGLARGHTSFALSAPEPIEPEAAGWLGAAGGIYSTPTDLARWNLALIGGNVLRPDSLRIMTSGRTLTNGKLSDYGCGLTTRLQSGRTVLAHNGAVAGFEASNATVPSTRSSVVLLCNLDGGLGSLPGQILGLLLKEKANVPVVRGPSATETARRLLRALQRGKLPRAEFTSEFNDYLTTDRLAGAARRLRAFGTPTAADLVSARERGGLEVSVTRFTFKGRPSLHSLMYRRPDGLVEQFFVYPD